MRRAVKDADIQSYVPYYYRIPKCTVPVSQANRPVIVGFGPAGMFAALVLAKAGLRQLYWNVENAWSSDRKMWQISEKPAYSVQTAMCSLAKAVQEHFQTAS